MKLLAFPPNVAAIAPPSPPPAHGGGEPSFASVLHRLNAPEVEARLKGQKSDGADPDSIASSGSGSEGKPAPEFSSSIEIALAALGYPSLAPSSQAAGPARPVETVAIARARGGSTSSPAAPAARLSPEIGGAEPLGDAPSQSALLADATLDVQSVQTRTYVTVAGNRPPLAGPFRTEPPPAVAAAVPAPQPGPAPLSTSQTRVTQSDGASLANAIAASAGDTATPAPAAPIAVNAPPTLRTKAPPSQPVLASARGPAAPAPDAPGDSEALKPISGERAQASEERSGAAGDGPPSAAPAATPMTANVAPVAATAALAPIAVNRLADFVASEAASLAAESVPAASPQASAISAAQAVKELEIALDPAELGAVSIKMRLANGKLTVVIGAANASTRQAIESDREAILDRLASSPQPLETLIIKSEGPTQVQFGGNDASDPNDPRRSHANGDPASAERGAGGGERSGRGQSGNATFGRAPPRTLRGRSGDLIV